MAGKPSAFDSPDKHVVADEKGNTQIIAPVNIDQDTAASAQHRFWEMFKANFLKILPNDRGTIVVDKGGYTPSEGMGHAMFFAAERRDWKTFNSLVLGLANFRKTNGLLRWKINSDGNYPSADENLNCATETEQNVVNALFLAYERTGTARYLEVGQAFLDAIWRHAAINFQDKRIILPTDIVNQYWPVFTGDGSLCQPGEKGLDCKSIQKVVWSPSYLSPGNLRRFAKYDKVHDWNKAADAWYMIANAVLTAAIKEPPRFAEALNLHPIRQDLHLNPMPDHVYLIPSGKNKIGVEDLHPKSAFESEKIMDVLRIPIYVARDPSQDAYAFLTRFYQAIGPQSGLIGEQSGSYPGYDPGPEVEIGAYGSGLQAIGRNVSAYRQRVQILADGSFSQNGPDYYRDTICYYAYLLLNNMFPY
jgi:hypothetical protein